MGLRPSVLYLGGVMVRLVCSDFGLSSLPSVCRIGTGYELLDLSFASWPEGWRLWCLWV